MAEEKKSSDFQKVEIHPLVIASACDHYTRVAMGGATIPKDSPVFGLIFGTNDGNNISVLDATDAIYEVAQGKLSIPQEEIEKKVKLWTAVYVSYKILGWYSFGNEATLQHLDFYGPLLKLVDAPIFLLFNPDIMSDKEELPINAFSIENHENHPIFIEVPFKIESTEVEKLSLNEITKKTPIQDLSSLENQNQSVEVSLNMLRRKVDYMIKVLISMKNNEKQVNHELLRKAKKICQSLPALGEKRVEKDLGDDVMTSQMISFLAQVTDVTNQLHEVGDVCSLVYAERAVENSF